MKLCPCGFYGDATRTCNCSEPAIQRYRSRLSGPLLDRIDLHLMLAPVPLRQLGATNSAENSHAIRGRVEAARERQRERYAGRENVGCNAQTNGRTLLRHLTADGRELLDSAADSLALSARAYHRVVKVARTIADLANDEGVGEPYVAEALRYRPQAGPRSSAVPLSSYA
jgi:magnesium chelatase family protein